MRVEKILKKSYGAAGDTEQMTYSANHINGLLITSVADTEDAEVPWLDDDYITVVMRDGTRTEVMIQRMPVKLFCYLGAVNHGFDFDTGLLFLDIVTEVETLASDTTLFNTVQQFPVLIPLGSLWLDNAEIDITLESGSSASAARTMGVYAYQDQPEIDFVQRYRLVKDPHTALPNVHQIFCTSHFNSGTQISPSCI